MEKYGKIGITLRDLINSIETYIIVRKYTDKVHLVLMETLKENLAVQTGT